MSNTKTVMGQASNQYVVPTDITDVFSTYLYTGTGSAQTITNGIDLDGEGGLVWIKDRSTTEQHVLTDTERGATKFIKSNSTGDEQTNVQALTAFNSNGFSIGNYADVNQNTDDFASWTFRKAPKFFDVVTWTGTGSKRTVSHNLGSTPGMIVIKRTDASGDDWDVWHRSLGSDGSVNQYYVQLSTDYAASLTSRFGIYGTDDPNDTTFTVKSQSGVNASGATYVAYLFAHNDGDGGFGPDGDQDIIKCGSYTGNGSDDGPEIDLGFEPQWLLVKSADQASKDWQLADVMREWRASGQFARLRPHRSDAEDTANNFRPTATGFKLTATGSDANTSGGTYIYMAIRRGPLAAPTAGTEVFAIDNQTASSAPFLTSNFPVDMVIRKRTTGSNSEVMSRLTQGKGLFANATSAEQTDSVAQFDFNDGCLDGTSTDTSRYGWMWKRAPGYFDVVAYTGNGTAGRTVSHNLGVAPEMMWIKKRSGSYEWIVYSPAGDGYLRLNTTEVYATSNVLWNATSPTATEFTLGGFTHVNGSGETYIAYLFASLPGISKVGSYTGSNSVAVEVDCGFTSGARFVLIKRTDAVGTSGNWYVYDSVRGIVSNADDPYLLINTTDAEAANTNNIEPLSSGFKLTVQGSNPISINGGSYIFYAIA